MCLRQWKWPIKLHDCALGATHRRFPALALPPPGPVESAHHALATMDLTPSDSTLRTNPTQYRYRSKGKFENKPVLSLLLLFQRSFKCFWLGQLNLANQLTSFLAFTSTNLPLWQFKMSRNTFHFLVWLHSLAESKRLGQPGMPGGQDLEEALRSLSARQESHSSDRPFFDVERERKLRALGGSSAEGSSGFLTPNDSLASTGTNYSGSSQHSSATSSSRSYLPERLQIVKPLEGE